ncbi:oxalate:formate antiporter [Plakobranchus ocellatus]|uniref:Oxalate:formate antiporter n=1 Tax=Plakobranchus ocellatus TaxID=259542 RepID=A0AAV4DW22_9GAST|nr:oxalate:formate antiporter [Plakobranchus ocellatus]
MAPKSFMWFYGNLATYMDSYFKFSCYSHCSDGDPQWLLSLYVAGMFPGLFIVRPIETIFGLKWTGIIAMVMANTALLGSAWSLQYSVAWTAVIYGTLLGPAAGITASVSIQVISGWAPERAALLMATSTGMATMLSVLQNQIITAYVNPENLKPDAQIAKTYFSQPEILDRVPDVVIILGAMTLGLQAVGYLLTKNPPKDSTDLLKKPTTDKIVSPIIATYENEEYIPFEYANSLDNVQSYQAAKSYVRNVQNPKCADTDRVSKKGQSQITTVEIPNKRVNRGFRTNDLRSYSPKEVLKLPVFYAVFLCGTALEYGTQLTANFYKTFALLYLCDDKYLTLIGTFIPITSACSRILFGMLLDKGFLNFQDVTVLGLSLNSVIGSFWYIAPQVNKILYTFVVLGLAVAQSLYYVVVQTAPLMLFGPSHISTNYGLLASCTFVASTFGPVINTVLDLQWIITSGSIFSLFVLCFVAFTRFDTQK